MLITAWSRCDFHLCDEPVVYLSFANVMTDWECFQLDNSCPPQHLLLLVDTELQSINSLSTADYGMANLR